MQLRGNLIVAPKLLMLREIMVDGTCHLITLDRALFLRRGETLRLEGTQPVVERLDGTVTRPACRTATVRWSYRLS